MNPAVIILLYMSLYTYVHTIYMYTIAKYLYSNIATSTTVIKNIKYIFGKNRAVFGDLHHVVLYVCYSIKKNKKSFF